MIPNQSKYEGEPYHCNDGLWRIRYVYGTTGGVRYFPIAPDGFKSEPEATRWWKLTGQPVTCRVCGTVFFSARDDGEFCRPACRAKFNRHQQGASEHVGTGAYWQRPEENRTHKKRADTFTYQCEWCGKTCTARAEAKRSGERAPKYCNDNGGKCRQAAYRAARSKKSGSSRRTTPPPGNRSNSGPYGAGGQRARTEERPDPTTPRSTPPKHSGPWRTTADASAFLVEAMCYVRKIPRNAWAKSGDYKELIAWAKKYITENHPDKTGKPADTFYKTISDCYSYMRKHA